MWISQARYDALVGELKHCAGLAAAHELALDKERIKNTLLERALATAQANVDWLRVMANQLSLDRNAIAAANLRIELPTPTFSGALQTPADIARRVESGGGPNIEPADAAANTVGRALAEDDVDSALAAYSGVVHGFEDVGDEAAAEQGIRHAEDGTVEYGKP